MSTHCTPCSTTGPLDFHTFERLCHTGCKCRHSQRFQLCNDEALLCDHVQKSTYLDMVHSHGAGLCCVCRLRKPCSCSEWSRARSTCEGIRCNMPVLRCFDTLRHHKSYRISHPASCQLHRYGDQRSSCAACGQQTWTLLTRSIG